MTETPQTAIDEREVDAPQLLNALAARQDVKNEMKTLRKDFKQADGHVRALLEEQGLADGEAIRIGQFRITRKAIASRSVTFETDPTSRLTISLIPES